MKTPNGVFFYHVRFFVSGSKSGDAFLVSKENFFKQSLNETKKEDITFHNGNTQEQVKFTTKAGTVYSLKKSRDSVVVINVEQKLTLTLN